MPWQLCGKDCVQLDFFDCVCVCVCVCVCACVCVCVYICPPLLRRASPCLTPLSPPPLLSPVCREVALRNSPSKLVPQLKLSSSSSHIVVAVAENDSPEFRKQSEEYYKVSAADREYTGV